MHAPIAQLGNNQLMAVLNVPPAVLERLARAVKSVHQDMHEKQMMMLHNVNNVNWVKPPRFKVQPFAVGVIWVNMATVQVEASVPSVHPVNTKTHVVNKHANSVQPKVKYPITSKQLVQNRLGPLLPRVAICNTSMRPLPTTTIGHALAAPLELRASVTLLGQVSCPNLGGRGATTTNLHLSVVLFQRLVWVAPTPP